MDETTTTSSNINLKDLMQQSHHEYDKIMREIAKGEETMTELLMQRGGSDNMLGGGLVGGLVLGALLRNGNNGLFGGVDNAGVSQPQANMSIMSGIGDIKQGVAVAAANMETSNAQQSGVIQAQLSGVAGNIVNAVSGVKDAVTGSTVALMQQLNGVQASVDKNAWAVTTAISTDGDKTRALITQQYEATLNRQLGEANAAIIELRSQQALQQATRGVEVTTTNNINQMQAQQQQQQQAAYLANLVGNLANDLQYIRATNQAINIGGGSQTANPINTNNNVRT